MEYKTVSFDFSTGYSTGHCDLNLWECFPCPVRWLKRLDSKILRYANNEEQVKAEIIDYMRKLLEEASDMEKLKAKAASYFEHMENAEKLQPQIDRIEIFLEKIKGLDLTPRGKEEVKKAREDLKELKKQQRHEDFQAKYLKTEVAKMEKDQERLSACLEYLEGGL